MNSIRGASRIAGKSKVAASQFTIELMSPSARAEPSWAGAFSLMRPPVVRPFPAIGMSWPKHWVGKFTASARSRNTASNAPAFTRAITRGSTAKLSLIAALQRQKQELQVIEACAVALVVWHVTPPCFSSSAISLSPIHSITRDKFASRIFPNTGGSFDRFRVLRANERHRDQGGREDRRHNGVSLQPTIKFNPVFGRHLLIRFGNPALSHSGPPWFQYTADRASS